jgi:allophanate hydrolase
MRPLTLDSLTASYETGDASVAIVFAEISARIAAHGKAPVWISLVSQQALTARIARIERLRREGKCLPLFGIPFAVKDNIDVAGLPTTAACPDFAYIPEKSAHVVERLEEAGAVLVGKTNLDQFATGLVGTRSPYGACHSVFSSAHVSGGSSSGSAVAVASGFVSFSLGTDTAGSGRVPAAFNNIVGLKPTKGLVSTSGVVPACRTLDCVSIFAGCVADSARVLSVAAEFDENDAYARHPATPPAFAGNAPFRFGVPRDVVPDDADARSLHDAAIAQLTELGGIQIDFDFAPFARAGTLLYQGPFVAERLTALQQRGFLRFDTMDPVVAGIISAAESLTAAQVFAAQYALAEIARETATAWRTFDVMLLPTAGFHPAADEVQADPVGVNARLGAYTNFVNLLDLSACAIPAGLRKNGLPYGVSLIAPAFADQALSCLAARLHAALPDPRIGATDIPLPQGLPPPAAASTVDLAVVGAHLSGEPLNHQLTSRGAKMQRTARTAQGYRLLALAGTHPPKPGLVRDSTGAGLIEVEIWRMSLAAFGSFTQEVPQPLAIGTVTLEDGSSVKGFVCEPSALAGATDITGYHGWRSWRNRSA